MTSHLILIATDTSILVEDHRHSNPDDIKTVLQKSQRVTLLSVVRQLKRLGIRADMAVSSDYATAKFIAVALRRKNVVRAKPRIGFNIASDDVVSMPHSHVIVVDHIDVISRWIMQTFGDIPIVLKPYSTLHLDIMESEWTLSGLWPAPKR